VFGMSDMQFCKTHLRAVKAKPTDWESVFDAKRNFADPGRCAPFWSAEQKATPYVAPIAAHGLQVRCSALRALGSSRQRVSLPRRRVGVQFTAPARDLHVPNRDLGTVEHVNSNGDLGIRMDSNPMGT
jgi:hypothetical protein